MAPRTSKSTGSPSRPQAGSKGTKASSRSSEAQSERARGYANASKRSSSSGEKKPSNRGR